MRGKEISKYSRGTWGSIIALCFVAFAIGGSRPAQAQADQSNIVSGGGTVSNRVIRCIKEVVSDCGDGVVDLNGDGFDDTRITEVVRETDLNECAGATTDPCGPSNDFMNCELVVPALGTLVQYTGLISNAPEDGHQVTHTHAEACSRPNQPTQARFLNRQILENATVNGLTGNLEITIQGTAKGDTQFGDPSVTTITSGSIIIKGVSGQLEGASGRGALDGEAWYNGSINAYTAKIKLAE